MGTEKRCGNCEWHEREDISGGCVCVNKYSDFCTEFTDDDFCCPRYMRRAGAD